MSSTTASSPQPVPNVTRRQLATYLKPVVHSMVEEMAANEMRTVADYIRTLILRDIREKLGAEKYEQALQASGLLKGLR